jgi:hypothetical protein
MRTPAGSTDTSSMETKPKVPVVVGVIALTVMSMLFLLARYAFSHLAG